MTTTAADHIMDGMCEKIWPEISAFKSDHPELTDRDLTDIIAEDFGILPGTAATVLIAYYDNEKKRINEDVVILIKNRLAAGAKKYGEEILVDDSRDMLQESLEEILDACVYLACKLIQLKRVDDQ